MLKDITLGQFFPGNSAVHRLDPRVKIVLTVLPVNPCSSRKARFPMR